MQIYLTKNMQQNYQTISQSNKNLFNSIENFKKNNPNASFKDWVPEYIATNTANLNLTRKGVKRRNTIINYNSNNPLINRCNHLLSDNELKNNRYLQNLFHKNIDNLVHLKNFKNLKNPSIKNGLQEETFIYQRK